MVRCLSNSQQLGNEYFATVARDAVFEHGALQKPEEIAHVLGVLAPRTPMRILEIGSFRGGSLYAWAKATDRVNGQIYSIDKMSLPSPASAGVSRISGALGEVRRSFWLGRKLSQLIGPMQNAWLIRGDSHSQRTHNRLKNLLFDHPIDFLFIDGDHSYEGVKRDFEMYGPLVYGGGVIALHDINPHDPRTGCDVPRFWQELKRTHKTREIVVDPARDNGWGPWGGIGLVYKF